MPLPPSQEGRQSATMSPRLALTLAGMKRFLRRAALFLLIAVLTLGALSATPWGSRVVAAGRLLADMGMGLAPDAHSSVNGEDTASARGVTRNTLTFDYSGRSYEADMYLADNFPRAALVLVPGLAPRGKEDPRLVDLATTLARAHFAVLVPNLPSLMQQ